MPQRAGTVAACLLHALYPGTSAAEVLQYTKACHDQRTEAGQRDHPSPESDSQIAFVTKFCETIGDDGFDSGAMFGETAASVLGGRRR